MCRSVPILVGHDEPVNEAGSSDEDALTQDMPTRNACNLLWRGTCPPLLKQK